MKNILVTGATGYIGAHLCKTLHKNGHSVVGVDIKDDQNDVEKYCKRLHILDINIDELYETLQFKYENYDAIVHLAGLIQVGESVIFPSKYYQTNLFGTIKLLDYSKNSHFIFASTAGCFEPQSPYAKSKLCAEDVIKEKSNSYTIFRFFNVAGSNGEHGQVGTSSHLIKVASEVLAGKRDKLQIYGNNYTTRDGTCIRDYIHVNDLCDAILTAINTKPSNSDYECIGSGTGYSVLEVIQSLERVTEKTLNYEITNRREGDPQSLLVDCKSSLLKITKTLDDMCLSAYKYEMGIK